MVATVCVGAFMGQLDASIVSLAFPTLQRQFDAPLGAVTWVGLVYLLVLVASVTAMGRLADMVGRKLLYTYGFAVFIAGSALCGVAPSLLSLDGFRVLQAVGAAMMQANSVAIITLAVPRSSLGRAIGVQGAAQAVGLALGPAVGGLLLAAGGWRLLFLVNVPFGVIGMVAGLLLIPRSRELAARSRFDWAGLGLFVPAVLAVMVVISLGNVIGWTSAVVVGSAAIGVLLGAAFVRRERRTAAPMLDTRLFRSLPFSAGVASGLLAYLVMFGVLLVVPFFLERALGLSPGLTGLELATMPVALGLVAPFAGRLADRLGARVPTVAGMLLVTVTLAMLAFLHPGQSAVVVGLALVGAGLGLFTPSNNAAIMTAAPRSESGVASGVLNMARGMGTALGLALTGMVFGLVAPPAAGLESALAFLAAVAAVAVGVTMLRGRARLTEAPAGRRRSAHSPAPDRPRAAGDLATDFTPPG